MAGAAVPLLPRLPRLPQPARRAPTVVFGGVDVQPRSAWGADLPPKGPLAVEERGDVRFLLVHHSASSNAYGEGDVVGILRGFYGFHTSSDKGWPDLAYNFLIDRFGRVWEGRAGSLEAPVKGDATGGSQGFAILSCFVGDHTREAPTPAAIDAMGKLLGALASRHQIDVRPGAKITFVSRGSNLHPAGKTVSTPTIAGHRDMSKTSCPGDACYRLISSRLIPAAVASAGAAPAAIGPTATVGPATDPTAPTVPAPPAELPLPTTAPGATLPPANAGGVALDTTPGPTVPPEPEPKAVGPGPGRGRDQLGPAAAAGGAVAAAGLVALVLRHRASSREKGHWIDARRLDDAELDHRAARPTPPPPPGG